MPAGNKQTEGQFGLNLVKGANLLCLLGRRNSSDTLTSFYFQLAFRLLAVIDSLLLISIIAKSTMCVDSTLSGHAEKRTLSEQ